MSNRSESRFGVTADDLRRYDWQARLAQHPTKECYSYCGLLVMAAKELEAAGDELGRRVFTLLYIVASFHPNYDTKGNPYGPLWQNNENRGLMAEDLSDDDLTALRGVLEEIADPEYRARVGDVLWECRRDYKAAQIAVQAFLESARRLESNDLWPPFAERLERALQIATKLGFGKALHLTVIAEIEAVIQRFAAHLKSGLLCARLMKFLLEHDRGDPACYVTLAQRMATEFATARDWDFSKDYWEVAALWFRKAKNEAEAQRCQLAAAECLVTKAEESLKGGQPSFGFAAHWMGRGVEALRRAKAHPTRIDEIHTRFVEYERRSLSELKAIEIDLDAIPGFREAEQQTIAAAQANLRGHSFEIAVGRLACVTKPTDAVALRKEVEANASRFIFTQLGNVTALDSSGKVADSAPSLTFGSPEEREEGIRKQMVQQASQVHWPMQVGWKIEPARLTIIAEHGVRLIDLGFLVDDNPLIPFGHSGIYQRGIQAGFFGDWLVSMHLIIPQIEASLRYVLQQNGVITSTLESDGTQKERDLNQLLWLPETEKVFGADITFDLRGILVERFGCNMRNESAHGLMPEGAFYQPAASYLWWLVIHLCWKGYRLAKAAANKETS